MRRTHILGLLIVVVAVVAASCGGVELTPTSEPGLWDAGAWNRARWQ